MPVCRASVRTPEGTLIAFRLANDDRDKASELLKRLVGPRT